MFADEFGSLSSASPVRGHTPDKDLKGTCTCPCSKPDVPSGTGNRSAQQVQKLEDVRLLGHHS